MCPSKFAGLCLLLGTPLIVKMCHAVLEVQHSEVRPVLSGFCDSLLCCICRKDSGSSQIDAQVSTQPQQQ